LIAAGMCFGSGLAGLVVFVFFWANHSK
jgi:hypothetical protein